MKKVKVGTLSVNLHTPGINCGAILHSYAFIEYLKKLDYVSYAEVIDYVTPHVEHLRKRYGTEKSIKKFGLIGGLARTIRKKYYHRVRLNRFKEFAKEHMVVSKEKYNQRKLKNANLDYDVLVVESDVIWSPGLFKGELDPAFFLAFDNMKDKKRVAYSPSMGDCKFDEKQFADLKELIKNIQVISCRESYMKDFLKDIVDKPVTHVLDPVMLLDAKEYDKITAPRLTEKKYILLYLPVNDNKTLREHAKAFAEKMGYYIIEYSQKYNWHKGEDKWVIPDGGVEEFLSAIKNAEVIFTNSFHAVCFSIIFKKQFYAFSRHAFGKVKNVCESMGLANHFFENDEFVELPKINYKEVYKKYDKLRKQSEKFIENALTK